MATTRTEPELDSAGNRAASSEQLSAFLRVSGYKSEDVVGSNYSRRAFVTSNGGKYVLSKSGRVLRRLSGPPTPKERDAAQEAEGEDE